MTEATADWLLDEVMTGLQKLISLSLANTPAMETIELTAASWMEVLRSQRWSEDQDQWRVQAAFLHLMKDSDRWPAPRNLLDRLPPRQPQKALPAPEMSPEQVAENLRRIREMLKPILQRGTDK